MLIHQMDVVTAFLNGTLDDDIYMTQLMVTLYLEMNTWCVSLKNHSMD